MAGDIILYLKIYYYIIGTYITMCIVCDLTWPVIIECPNDIALGLCSMCMWDFMLSPSMDSDELESKLDGGPPTIFSHPSPIPVGLRLPDMLWGEQKHSKY